MRLLAVALALLTAASPAAAGRVQARLSTSTPSPVVGQPWRWTVTVRDASGAPVRARLRLQILLGETVVGCWRGGEMMACSGQAAGDWIPIRGRRSGVLRWPAESVGVQLTFQAVVRAGAVTTRLRAPVRVRPAPS